MTDRFGHTIKDGDRVKILNFFFNAPEIKRFVVQGKLNGVPLESFDPSELEIA